MISKIGFRMLFQTSPEIINNVLYNNPTYLLSPGKNSPFFSYIFNIYFLHDVNIKSEFGLFFSFIVLLLWEGKYDVNQKDHLEDRDHYLELY